MSSSLYLPSPRIARLDWEWVQNNNHLFHVIHTPRTVEDTSQEPGSPEATEEKAYKPQPIHSKAMPPPFILEAFAQLSQTTPKDPRLICKLLFEVCNPTVWPHDTLERKLLQSWISIIIKNNRNDLKKIAIPPPKHSIKRPLQLSFKSFITFLFYNALQESNDSFGSALLQLTPSLKLSDKHAKRYALFSKPFTSTKDLPYEESVAKNPLHSACEKGLSETVANLLSKGCDPDALNSDGKTPLSIASAFLANHQSKQEEIIKTLLRYNADPNVRNADGSLPCLFVNSLLRGHKKIKLLRHCKIPLNGETKNICLNDALKQKDYTFATELISQGVPFLLSRDLYCRRHETLICDSGRRSTIEALRSERGSPSPSGKGDEEDRLCKVAASQKSKFHAGGSITGKQSIRLAATEEQQILVRCVLHRRDMKLLIQQFCEDLKNTQIVEVIQQVIALPHESVSYEQYSNMLCFFTYCIRKRIAIPSLKYETVQPLYYAMISNRVQEHSPLHKIVVDLLKYHPEDIHLQYLGESILDHALTRKEIDLDLVFKLVEMKCKYSRYNVERRLLDLLGTYERPDLLKSMLKLYFIDRLLIEGADTLHHIILSEHKKALEFLTELDTPAYLKDLAPFLANSTPRDGISLLFYYLLSHVEGRCRFQDLKHFVLNLVEITPLKELRNKYPKAAFLSEDKLDSLFEGARKDALECAKYLLDVGAIFDLNMNYVSQFISSCHADQFSQDLVKQLYQQQKQNDSLPKRGEFDSDYTEIPVLYYSSRLQWLKREVLLLWDALPWPGKDKNSLPQLLGQELQIQEHPTELRKALSKIFAMASKKKAFKGTSKSYEWNELYQAYSSFIQNFLRVAQRLIESGNPLLTARHLIAIARCNHQKQSFSKYCTQMHQSRVELESLRSEGPEDSLVNREISLDDGGQ